MARIDVIMPQMGESIAEGTLSKWLKKLGEPVKRDEPIFEISTDKVDAEIPAPAAGVLAEVLVQEGQTVAVQTVVARIETEAGAAAPHPAPAAPPAPPPTPPPQTPRPTATPAPSVSTPSSLPKRSPAVAPPAAGVPESAEERLRRKSTPLVRRMAAEHQLDLTTIPGTGLAGRVTRQDVLEYLERGVPSPAPPTPVTAPTPASSMASPPSGGPAVEPWEGDRVEPWSRIRKLTADHMVMSRRVSAHVHSLIEVDYTRVAQLRTRWKGEIANRGVSLTYLAFIAKAVAESLRKHPVLNAAVSGEATIFRRDVNLGIAVALDWGLIVPVVRHADELSLVGLARAIGDLAERARAKQLTPDEVQKGTFTITNPGGFGTLVGLPILNQPQAAILAVGAIEKRPAVVTAPDGTESLAIRTRGILALSFDHRIVDGADADRFLAEVRRILQEFPDSAG
jgi:2-oxoglutarate dehydrogenase E2 component (dihydrolipoamide succinyltransferase)